MQLGLVVAALWVVFGSGWFEELKLFYILFLPLMWIAMRHGIEGTTIATVVIQIGLIVAMWLGDYGAGASSEFQFLLLAVAVTGLFLGLTVSERREIALQLRDKQFELDRSLRLTGASEMASALAHELNQPLSAIGNYVRACQVMIVAGSSRRPPRSRTPWTKSSSRSPVPAMSCDSFATSFALGPVVSHRWTCAELLQSALDTARPRLERHHVAWRLDCPVSLPAGAGGPDSSRNRVAQSHLECH